jgi:PAS domain S-box-containing protein
MYDVDGNLLLANDLIARYMESSEKNLVGKSCLDLFGNVLGSEVLARVKKAVKSGVTEKYESEVELPLGRCWLRSHYTPIRNAQNEFIGVQVISEDITELKSLAIDRQRYMEQVEKDNIALERKHAALLEVTSLLQAERNRLGQEFQANKRLTIDPLLEQLKVKAGKSLQSTISALEAAISGIASPLLQQLIVAFADLTPRELEVCGLIAKGNSSKEIAEIFSISLLTVHKLRQRIRTKLQLSGDDTDLGTYLRAQKARSEP